MAKLIIILSIALSPFVGHAQLVPKDIPTIEASIAGHKAKYKALGNRNSRSSINSTLSVKYKSVTGEVNELTKKVSKHLEKGYIYLGYAQQITRITKLLIEAGKKGEKYTTFFLSEGIKNPLIFKWYEKSFAGITEEIKKCSNLISIGMLVSSTHKQKLMVLNEIEASLVIINYGMTRALYMGEGILGLKMSFNESFAELMGNTEFKQKMQTIAEKIIANYSK